MDNWFEAAILNPYLRQKPLCVYGPGVNKSLVISFLIGYFKPMTAIEVTYTDLMNNYNSWLLDRQLIVVTDTQGKQLPRKVLYDKEIRVHSKIYEPQTIRNVTKWIVESDIILPDCVTLDIKGCDFRIYTHQDAVNLGIEHRRRCKKLTKSFLRGVLK